MNGKKKATSFLMNTSQKNMGGFQILKMQQKKLKLQQR